MKTTHHIIRRTLFAFLITLASSVSAATTFWSGAVGDGLWSSGGNWSAGVPGITSNVIFTNDGVALDAFTANNILDPAFLPLRINALRYMNTNGFHNTHL